MNFDLPELTSDAPRGALCQVRVKDLKPTQNAVGFDEVNNKVARYSAKTKGDLRDYLLVHPVPVVIGNGGNFYLTDHHHMANALWRAAEGKKKGGHRYQECARGRYGGIQSRQPYGIPFLEDDA